MAVVLLLYRWNIFMCLLREMTIFFSYECYIRVIVNIQGIVIVNTAVSWLTWEMHFMWSVGKQNMILWRNYFWIIEQTLCNYIMIWNGFVFLYQLGCDVSILVFYHAVYIFVHIQKCCDLIVSMILKTIKKMKHGSK